MFDFDFRDPDIDGSNYYAAGYMMLGHHGLRYPSVLQFRGSIHALDFHNATLPDESVLDVAASLVGSILPDTPKPALCRECVVGRGGMMTKTPGLSASRAGLAGTRARLERLLVTAFALWAAQPLSSVLRALKIALSVLSVSTAGWQLMGQPCARNVVQVGSRIR